MPNTLSANEMNLLVNVISRGAAQGAESLNKILNQPIYLHPPHVKFCMGLEFLNEIKADSQTNCFVKMAFNGIHQGETIFFFSKELASPILEATLAMTIEEGDPLFKESLMELGNIVVNGVMGTIGNIFKQEIQYRPPTYFEGQLKDTLHYIGPLAILSIETQFEIHGTPCTGHLLLVYQEHSLEALKSRIRTL